MHYGNAFPAQVMLKHWTIFEGSPNGLRREKLRVTLGANRTLNMNAATYEALGNPIAVELRFDEAKANRHQADHTGIKQRLFR